MSKKPHKNNFNPLLSNTECTKTILLVEDEVLIAMDEAAVLKKHGFRVITAYNGKNAIEAVLEHDIDLVLMDIDLGEDKMDGTEAAEIILQERDLPVIFLTSHTEKEMVEKVKGITRYGYVLKDAGEFVLIESITMAFELFRSYSLIREKERQLELAMDAANHAFWDFDIDTGNTYFSPRYFEMLGYRPDELPMYISTFENLIHPDDRKSIVPKIFEKVNSGAAFEEVFRMKTKEGEWKWIRGAAKSYDKDEEGVPHRVVGTHEDITDRITAENQYQEAKLFYESILETVRAGIWVTNRDDGIIYVNAAMASIAGVKKEEIIGKRVLRDFPSATIGELKAFYKETKKTLRQVDYEASVTTPAGDSTIQKGWLFPRVRDGNYDGIICTIQDITHDKKTREALEQSERKYRSLVELSPDGIATVTSFGKVTSVNQAFADLTGYTKEDFIEKHFTQIPTLVKQDLPTYRHMFETILKSNKDNVFTFKWRHRSGEVRIGEARSKRLQFDSGGPTIQCVVRDITEQKKAEEGLKKALDEKNFFMRELNHRTKNNLAMISSLINLKNSSLKDDDRVDLSDLIHQIESIRIIYEKFSQTDNWTHINIKTYIPELLDSIFSPFTEKNVSVVTEFDDITMSAKNALPIGLIVNEIAVNAVKHGFDREDVEGKARFSVRFQQERNGKLYTLTLSNTGKPFPDGIDLNNPTTLGLKIVSDLVRQLNGTIKLKRKPRTEFTITFPVADES